MTVWPFVPIINFQESLTWGTDNLVARNGFQRINLRKEPKVVYTYSYHLPKTGNLTAVNKFLSENIIIPIWQDGEEIGNVSSGTTTTILSSLQNKIYKVGDYIFFHGVDETYEARLISAINGTTITHEALFQNYTSCYVAPAFSLEPVDSFRYNLSASDEYTEAEFSFQITTDHISSLNSYNLYESIPISPLRSLEGGGDSQLNTNKNYFESMNGPLEIIEEQRFQQADKSIIIEFLSLSEVRTFKSQLNYFKGQFKSFWLLDWTTDFILTNNVNSSDNYLIVQKDVFDPKTYSGYISIVKNDGTLIPLRVTSVVAESATEERLNLSSTVGQNVNMMDVELISRMDKYTLASDTVNINYEGQRSRISLSCKTVPE